MNLSGLSGVKTVLSTGSGVLPMYSMRKFWTSCGRGLSLLAITDVDCQKLFLSLLTTKQRTTLTNQHVVYDKVYDTPFVI